MNRSLTAFTLACLVFAGCAKKDKEAEAEPVVPVQVAEVQRASIQRLVTADAILYTVNQASIMPRSARR